MSKGMSLEEFRESLASDASKENESLKKELKELKKSSDERIRELEEQNKFLREDCRALANRCFVSTGMSIMCFYCIFREYKCEHEVSFEAKVKMAKKLRKECREDLEDE